MHDAWLISVITKAPQEAILDQKAVSLGYLVQWPWRMLTPNVNYIQLQVQVTRADTRTCSRAAETWEQALLQNL